MDIENAKIIKPKSIIKTIQVINLETSKNCMISKADKLIVHNDTIYILDSRQNALFLFNKKGIFIKKIQRIGKGPGEYTRITSFCIEKETGKIILLTNNTSIQINNNKGEFLKEIKFINFGCHHIEYLQNNKLILYSMVGNYRFHIFDIKTGQVISEKIINNDFYKTGFGYRYSPFVNNYDSSISFTNTYTYLIYNITPLGDISHNQLDFGKHNYNFENIPLDIGRSYKNIYKMIFNKKKYVFNIFYFFESEHFYFTAFIFNKKTQTLVYNKIKEKSFIINNFYFPIVKYFSDNKLYTVAEPLKINKYIPSSFEINTNINFSANPVIIIYKFKEDE